MLRAALLGLMVCATPCFSQTLDLPSNAKLTRNIAVADDSYDMAIGAWRDGAMPVERGEGRLSRQAWRITATGLTSLQLLRPLRAQLADAGFDIIFECRDVACGGFDFRFAMPVLPPPEMQVNLGDFRYLAARKDGDGQPVLVSVLTSKSPQAGHIQITRVGADTDTVAASRGGVLRGATVIAGTDDLSTSLAQHGRAVLTGLVFETGSSRLGKGPFPSLQALAGFLQDNKKLNIALVGHTDADGSLDGNIRLSKRRAISVLERLVSDYQVDRRQLDAQGMGYLSPVASNLTAQGRAQNRRVEVIVTNTN